MIKPKIVSDWRVQLQRPSVQFHILGIVLSGGGTAIASIYGNLDPIQHAQIPPVYTCGIFLIVFLCSIAGRFLEK